MLADTAPPFRCTRNVTTHEPTARAKKGSFSNSTRGRAGEVNRRKGKKSRSSKTNGTITSIGLLINPSAKHANAAQYHVRLCFLAGTDDSLLATNFCVYTA